MRKFLVGLLVGIILLPAGVYLYLRSGRAPVATSAPPMPFERFLVRTAMHATIDHQEMPLHLAKVTDTSLAEGAKTYRQDCAFCHGLPGQPPSAAARGMFPRPPQFFRPNARRIDDPAGEVYWKVKNGIRLTGMPGFGGSLRDAQIRQLTAFLEDATSLPLAAKAALEGAQKKPASPPRVRHASPAHKRA